MTEFSTLTKSGTPRKRAPGAGPKPRLQAPQRVSLFVEASDYAALGGLPGDRAEHIRRAIRAYLAAHGE